ncbi:DUF6048 family protein [Marivirga atlantica]|jgi:hypothetical protein|uniref:DUF6048 family protein n=1 Tax=Marivirga atlantica TaxID=1548457 RepID=UPI001F1F5272|nr:DUF6048 family protein [Marivirga atlantica]
MLKSKTLLLLLFCSLQAFLVNAQSEETEQEIDTTKKKVIEVGLTFDYLKLHTLALDNSKKWEGAFNINLLNHYALIVEAGMSTLSPKDAYYNANYISEGTYYRLGFDYQTNINPTNLIMFGLRYSGSNYSENITYSTTNPLFEGQIGEIKREELFAHWYELVITSEKNVRRIFKNDIKDFLSLGFKFRLKSYLKYSQFELAETKQIPGFGSTVNKLNPEVNLFIKFRIPILKN